LRSPTGATVSFNYHLFPRSFFGELLTTWPVLTETTHQIPGHLVAPFLRLARTSRLRVVDLPGALPRVEELVQKYADHPMDLADALLVRVAEQTGVVDILTLDVSDFGTYRLKSGKRFRILPE